MKSSSNIRHLQPAVIFLLGAAFAGICMLLFFSADPAGGRSLDLEVSHLKNGPSKLPSLDHQPDQEANSKVASDHHAEPIRSTKAPLVNKTISHDEQDIEELARRATMDDRTVLMTAVNEAWAAPNSLLDAFFESFRIGENVEHFVKHLIIVALDAKAFERCKSVHPYCYFLRPQGVDLSAEKSYMTKDYLDLVWSKIKLQQRILELGYNLLFTDVDIAWFRNPLEHITLAADISTSSDFYFGNPHALGNYPNTGFIYFKSCKKNIEVMRYWHDSRRRWPQNHDQFVFNEIKHELVAKFGVQIKFLDTAYVSGFCQLGKDLNKVCTVHATCCIGLNNKLYDLRGVIEDWKNYTSHPVWQRQMGHLKWRLPGRCIH
ncbi:uncharacterized protein At4g15970-like [Ananas comosus]|uniref:Uncharacterized protein At4g15970-like n=1 Tax=Ananas comosus TaxID=4615 RepID=A0A199VTA4_ANACO|nr:uncharacterized protein At4g15970-like [Ananas comosus]OAY80452.1 Uncharacterized protein ACMD2_05803 [Ananas comosus]